MNRPMLALGLTVLAGMLYLALEVLRDGSTPRTGSGLRWQSLEHATSVPQASTGVADPAALRLIARALDPQLMTHSLPEGQQLDPTFALNPCWHERGGGEAGSGTIGRLRCLPGALLLGSFQAGSGTLFAKLSKHPDVVTVCACSGGRHAEVYAGLRLDWMHRHMLRVFVAERCVPLAVLGRGCEAGVGIH